MMGAPAARPARPVPAALSPKGRPMTDPVARPIRGHPLIALTGPLSLTRRRLRVPAPGSQWTWSHDGRA